jgi:hypothetical protein
MAPNGNTSVILAFSRLNVHVRRSALYLQLT